VLSCVRPRDVDRAESQVATRTDHDHSFTYLWNPEIREVDDRHRQVISRLIPPVELEDATRGLESCADQGPRLAPIRRQKSFHVLENKRSRLETSEEAQ